MINNMIRVMAQITLFNTLGSRKTPFSSGYRPLFSFKGVLSKVSGMITLSNGNEFSPGMVGEVEISFIKGILSEKDVAVGNKFTFDEGQAILGEGIIRKIQNI